MKKIFCNTTGNINDGNSRYYINKRMGHVEVVGSEEFVNRNWKNAVVLMLGYDPFYIINRRIDALIPAEFTALREQSQEDTHNG